MDGKSNNYFSKQIVKQGELTVLDSAALTKILSVALVALVAVAAVSGSAAYVLWNVQLQPVEEIRIGICADLDNTIGKGIWRSAILAAEEVIPKVACLAEK